MRIAVVDDLAADRKELHDRLTILLSRYTVEGQILEYENGKSFLAAAEEEHFDLVFLDIYLKSENGVDIAKTLRSFDQDCILIFTTTSTDHALDGFRVRALHYLVKPYADEELNALFREIIERLPTEDKYLDLRVSGGAARLRLKEILYAEHFQHCIHIHTIDEKTTVTRQTFGEFTAKLEKDQRFFLCSRGVVVNMEHAKDFDGNAFVLNNGLKIPVSRSNIKAARTAFGDFLFQRRERQ